MGDLRNKFRKEEERLAIEEMQRRLRPHKSAEVLPRCACGFTWHETKMMADYGASRFDPVKYYCPRCLPQELLWLLGKEGPDSTGGAPSE